MVTATSWCSSSNALPTTILSPLGRSHTAIFTQVGNLFQGQVKPLQSGADPQELLILTAGFGFRRLELCLGLATGLSRKVLPLARQTTFRSGCTRLVSVFCERATGNVVSGVRCCVQLVTRENLNFCACPFHQEGGRAPLRERGDALQLRVTPRLWSRTRASSATFLYCGSPKSGQDLWGLN